MNKRKSLLAGFLSAAILAVSMPLTALFGAAEPVAQKTAYTTYRVENADELSEGFQLEDAHDGTGGKSAMGNAEGRWFMFGQMDFGTSVLDGIRFAAATAAGGANADGYYGQQIEIRIDAVDGPVIGGFIPKNTGNWQNWTEQDGFINDRISGVHDVYFVYLNSSSNINEVTFTQGETFNDAYRWHNISMNLSTISTAELVKELSKREAVQKVTAEPYQSYQITVGKHTVSDTGPVVILRIWD